MPNKIFLSAGHSRTDSGCVAFGHTEAEIVLSFRDDLAVALRAHGATVATDGKPGENLPLSEAIRAAKQATGPRVEFHCNAGPSTATGVEALSLVSHKALAQKLCDAVHNVLGIVKRGDGGWKSDTSGQHHRLGFCREGDGIILELFFLSNKNDLNSYLAHKTALVEAVAKVLIDATGKI